MPLGIQGPVHLHTLVILMFWLRASILSIVHSIRFHNTQLLALIVIKI